MFYYTNSYACDGSRVNGGEGGDCELSISEVISDKDSNVNKTFVHGTELLYSNNYFVDVTRYCCGLDENSFSIYDTNGKKVLAVGEFTSDAGSGGGSVRTYYDGKYDLVPRVVESKLYYFEETNSKCIFKYVDLNNNLKINNISELEKGCPNGGS